MGSNMRTEMVLLSFLQYGSCGNHELVTELSSLGEQMKGRHLQSPIELMVDGDLQTDGIHFSRNMIESDLAVEESEEGDICRIIGQKLAEIGDKLDGRIHQEVIDNLIQNLLDDRLTTEEKDRRLARVIDSLMASVPAGLEQEKAKLILAMVLAKKVSASVPGLLPRIFWTTVGFINQHLCSYIENLTAQANL